MCFHRTWGVGVQECCLMFANKNNQRCKIGIPLHPAAFQPLNMSWVFLTCAYLLLCDVFGEWFHFCCRSCLCIAFFRLLAQDYSEMFRLGCLMFLLVQLKCWINSIITLLLHWHKLLFEFTTRIRWWLTCYHIWSAVTQPSQSRLGLTNLSLALVVCFDVRGNQLYLRRRWKTML